jgi:hypothetical protein
MADTHPTKEQKLQEMILVATHYRGKEMSRKAVKVKVTPKRYRIVEGLHCGDLFDRQTGKYVGAFNPFATFRFHLEQP